jgi:hypothetical protein
MSILSSRLRTLLVALPLLASLGACYSWSRRPAASPEPDRFRFLSGPVRVTRTEGPPIVLVGVRIGRDSLFGDERARPYRRVAIPLSDVRKVEARRVDPLTTGAVVVLSLAAFIAATGAFLIHSVP